MVGLALSNNGSIFLRANEADGTPTYLLLTPPGQPVPTPTPEPSAFLVLAIGAGGLAVRHRRRVGRASR